MRLFKKRDRVIDLTANYKKQQERADEIQEEMKEESKSNSSGGVLSFLGGMASANPKETPSTSSDTLDLTSTESSDKKRRLLKRLTDMTSKIEDLSNQTYKIEQRLELIERKINIDRY